MNEDLQKAMEAAKFAANDLRAALAKATAVEAILLIPMISEAEGLSASVKNLLDARAAQHG